MNRLYVFLRQVMNSSVLHPTPTVDLRLPRASSCRLELLLVDPGNDKAPIDVVGRAITFTVRRNKYPTSTSDIVIEKSVGNGISIDALNTGYVNIDFTAEDMYLAPTSYWYSIEIDTPAGATIRQSLGKMVLMS